MNEQPGGPASPGDHWDLVYERMTPTGVSWYEEGAATSLAIIEDLSVPRDAALLDVGGGASTLVDGLVANGYSDISVLDVSEVALAASRARVGDTSAAHWLHEDLLAWQPARAYGLWHDRALFHFLVEASRREAYLRALHVAVGPGGHVIIATFALDGPEQCSGLPVVRYDSESLMRTLGPEFSVVATRRVEHVTPGGVVQPFRWVVARRRGNAA